MIFSTHLAAFDSIGLVKFDPRLLTDQIVSTGPNASLAQLSIKRGPTQPESTSNSALTTLVPTHRHGEFLARDTFDR